MQAKTSSGKPNYIGRFGGLTVPGTPVGAIVSIGMVILCWLAIPIARPFILGTGGLGLIVGLILWWKHTKSHEEISSIVRASQRNGPCRIADHQLRIHFLIHHIPIALFQRSVDSLHNDVYRQTTH